LSGGLKGAFSGAIGGAIFGGLGAHFGEGLSLGKVLSFGTAGGITNVIQGGKFGHGFIAAGVTAVASGAKWIKAQAVGARTLIKAVVGGTVSQLTGGKFANGAQTAAFMELAKSAPEFYRDKVGYELDANPGGDAAGKGELGMPVKGANNVGTQEDTVDPNCTFCEGGSVSRVANQIPSINAIAGLHDVMQVSMGTSLWRDIFNIPGMALAAGTTYAGFLGNALNATPASLYVPLNFTDKRDSDDYTWIPAGGY